MSEQNSENKFADKSIDLPIKRVEEDDVEDILNSNAYHNILPARYLRKNEDGEVVEEPEEMFERIAKNVALADVVYMCNDKGDEIEVTPRDIKKKATTDRRKEICEEIFGNNVSIDSDNVTVKLTEDNIHGFSYDTIVPKLSDDMIKQVEKTKDRFHRQMKNLSIMPNSPTIMNAGDDYQQLSACFVNSPEDDIDDIHRKAKESAKIFQSGGGMGYTFSRLRPYGDRVGSTGGIASGPISFMRTYDQMCGTIAQGGKRRGAQMGILRVDHPDIIQFIHSKDKDVSLVHSLRLNDPDDFTHNSFGEALEEARDLIQEDEDGIERVPEHLRNAAEGHLSNFNISVGVTSRFMNAVRNDDQYKLINPRTGDPYIVNQETKELYSWFGLGDEIEVGEEMELPAREIFERMVEGAWDNGEPGMICLDRINDMHSFDTDKYPEHEILATNPCGEQPLEEGEACNLLHINLSTVVDKETPDWRYYESDQNFLEKKVEAFLEESIDWNILDERIKTGTHFLENVVTMSDFPLEKITDKVSSNRKIGLGIMGLAQMYVQMGVEYGSEEANEIARQLMKNINHKSKNVSHNMAVGKGEFSERGSFDNWDKSKYANPGDHKEWFEKLTGENPEDWIENGYPIRNHNTTTIAPTGTTSMIGDTTGGCEPIYQVAFYKNVTGDVQGDEMLVEFDDYFLRVLDNNDISVDQVKEEAEKQMEQNEFEGVYSLESVPDEIGELFVTTGELSAKDHGDIQCALQDGVDSSISKTINAPADATIEDAKEAFLNIYNNGGKGVTYYRDGTRSKQVLTTREDNQETSSDTVEDIKDKIDDDVEISEILDEIQDDSSVVKPKDRPKVLYGPTTEINTGYGDLYVNISEIDDGEPFEVFADIGKSGGYTESFTEATARLISLCLRSGIDPEDVIEQIDGIRSPKMAWDNGDQVLSVPDGIALAMRRYIDNRDNSGDTDKEKNQSKVLDLGENPECPDCDSLSLYYSEGCKTCESCGWSEC